MQSAAKGKFIMCQPRTRKTLPAVSTSSSSSMLPPSTTPSCTSAFLLSPSTSTSTSNAMDFSGLRAAADDIGAAPQTSPVAPSFNYLSVFASNSELMSASQGKHKYSVQGDGDQSRKCSHPSSITALAQQEGSAALVQIAQSLPQLMTSLQTTPAPQSERPPASSLGCAITALSEIKGLGLDDVMLLSEYFSANPNDAVVFAHLGQPLWKVSWAQRKFTSMCGNAQ